VLVDQPPFHVLAGEVSLCLRLKLGRPAEVIEKTDEREMRLESGVKSH
jgi:hypothetical protein